eukprot:3683656-Rhodomonas_salina.4
MDRKDQYWRARRSIQWSVLESAYEHTIGQHWEARRSIPQGQSGCWRSGLSSSSVAAYRTSVPDTA